jgi:hypothetical protein
MLSPIVALTSLLALANAQGFGDQTLCQEGEIAVGYQMLCNDAANCGEYGECFAVGDQSLAIHATG